MNTLIAKISTVAGMAVASALPLAAHAQQQEMARVISTTPVVQQVAVPRQTCQTTNTLPAANSGGGAVLGAVVGGLIGNAMGGGDSRGIATMAGMTLAAARPRPTTTTFKVRADVVMSLYPSCGRYLSISIFYRMTVQALQ